MKKICRLVLSFVVLFLMTIGPVFAVSVSTWADKSGNNENFVQSVNANMPTSGVSTINGLNTISFPGTGSDGYLVTGDQNFSRLLNAAYTMFFIQYTSNPSANIFDLWSGSNYPYFNFQNSGIFWDSDYTYPNPGRIQVTTPSAITHLWNLNFTPSASRFVNLDGTNAGSATTPVIDPYACPFSMGDIAGCAQTHGSLPWTGQTGELLLYKSSLSVTNYQLVEGYLAWKWGTQSLLPAAHPYKSAAPVGFNPKTSVSGLLAWYDASDASTINPPPPTNNTVVGSW